MIPAERLLFVKAFSDVPGNMMAPGEGEIEIYVDGAKKYVELEQQGPYASIGPGATVTWTVRWYLDTLPMSAALTAGSQALLDELARLAP